MSQIIRFWLAALLGLLFLVKAANIIIPPVDSTRIISPGIEYRKVRIVEPRPIVFHAVQIDLTSKKIKPFVTPFTGQVTASRTSNFAKLHNAVVAINASMFDPQHDDHFFNYYPREGEATNARALFISEGRLVSKAKDRYPVLCISSDKKISIQVTSCPEATRHAVSGVRASVSGGKISLPSVKMNINTQLHPRTAVALNKDGSILWFVVVDGRQGLYSSGCTEKELANFLIYTLGAYEAIEFDGGGSATLVGGELGVLNSPIHNGIPGRERPVANHIGIGIS